MYALLQSVYREQKPVLFYAGLSLLCAVGYVWVYWNLDPHHSLNVCVLKNTVDLPCPACGTTRSIEALLQGEWKTALWLNPLGPLAVLGLLVLPLWLAHDAITRQNSLYDGYVKGTKLLQQWQWALPLGALLVLNWAWNIWKGL